MKTMKAIAALCAAALAASMLTACGDTDTAEVTETSAETEGSVTTVSEETTLSVSEATEMTDATTETTTVGTTETVSETDTLSAESGETATETSAEPVESVSDTEAVEEAETVHWDTIVYDTTLKTDITDWELQAENVDRSDNICTLSEALELSDMPDAVTSYLYENSITYKVSFDNNEEIRGIASGVGDFDSDGVKETFYAVNYLCPYHDEALYGDWSPSVGRMGAYPSDIVVYDTADEKVYLCDNDTPDIYLTNVGCYFASDPAAECKSLDVYRYEECYTWEGTNMYFTDDNVFISCNLNKMDYMGWASASNRYIKLVYDNGEYRLESVGEAGWGLSVPIGAPDEDCYRSAFINDSVLDIVKQ